jgi:hypothetical protein
MHSQVHSSRLAESSEFTRHGPNIPSSLAPLQAAPQSLCTAQKATMRSGEDKFMVYARYCVMVNLTTMSKTMSPRHEGEKEQAPAWQAHGRYRDIVQISLYG